MSVTRLWVIGVLVLSLLLAGCAGVLPTDSDAETESTASIEDETTPPYETIPAGETVVETHEDRLREAGSGTIAVDSRIEVAGPDQNVDQRTNRTARIDYTTSPSRQYVVDDDGDERWFGTERNLTRNRGGRYARTLGSSGTVDGIDAETIDDFEFDGPEPIARDGDPHDYYRYEANGIDAVSESVRSDLENVTLERVSGTLVLRGDGLVVSAEVTLVATVDETSYEQHRSVRYTDVGSTDVSRPDWYDEALAETDPLPDETVTVTEELPAANATLEVTGEAADVASSYSSNPSLESRGTFSADELELAQVSCLVYVYLPDEFDSAELTIEYEDEHVPGGDEDGLALARYNRGSFASLGSVDPSTNTATTSIDTDGYYFVRHEPTYETAYVSGETVSETAPPPTCE